MGSDVEDYALVGEFTILEDLVSVDKKSGVSSLDAPNAS